MPSRRLAPIVMLAGLAACEPPPADGSLPACPSEPPETCEPGTFGEGVDPMVWAARGTGPTFIEILDMQADPERGLVFACTGTQGLNIWDVSAEAYDDSVPGLLATGVGPMPANDSFPRCQNLFYDSTSQRLALASRGDEVQQTPFVWLYDLSDPSAPVELGGWIGASSVEGLVVDPGGDRVWAAAHTDGVRSFNLQGSVLVGGPAFADDVSDAWKLARVDEDLLLAAEGASGLRLYGFEDTPEGPAPTLLSAVPLPGTTRDLLLAEDLDGRAIAWAVTSGSLIAVDIEDRANPVVRGEVETPGTSLQIEPGAGGLAFTAEWDRIRGYDLRDADAPSLVLSERVPTPSATSRVLTLATEPGRGRVYAGEWQGMHVLEQRDGAQAPDVHARPSHLQFGAVAAGSEDDRVLVVENQGTLPLTVYGIATDADSPVDSRGGCQRLEPGQRGAWEIVFRPDTDVHYQGLASLCSDDPDDAQLPLRVTGNVPGIDIGDPAPEFSLPALDGGIWTNTDTQGKVTVLAYFATF